MNKNIVKVDKAPAAVGAYSQGVCVNGTHYFSGMLGLDPATMELKDGFDGQVSQIMTNIDALLEGSSLKRENVVKTTVFVTDLKNFPQVNQAYETFFAKPYPARSCVQVSALPKGALVEIEMVAMK
jgi:2-iminobutanoate/2-iminopropanoate deaminase